MADLNKVMMIGRLTRDPVLRYTPNNQAVCDFGLAAGRKFKTASGEEREETVFVDCSVWAKGGEIFHQYMKKGKQVFIEGRLKLDQWDDKTTGQKRSKLTVVVENFQFLGGPGDGAARGDAGAGNQAGGYDQSQGDQRGGNGSNGGGGNGGGYTRPGGYGAKTPQRPANNEAPAEAPYGDEQQFKDDDIPF